MYYPIGLPKKLKIPASDGLIQSIVCNRDRNLFCILTEKAIWIWYNRPCIPLCGIRRSQESLDLHGTNVIIEWRPDSSQLVVATSNSKLLFYSITVDDKVREVYIQKDSPTPGLRRDSAELYTKEKIPPLLINQVKCVDVRGGILCLVCLRDELMVGCGGGHIQRLRWDGSLHYDYCIDLARVPFCDDQLVMQALPLTTPGVCVLCLEYSPLVGGFATVLSDGRAAFLTASTLQFDPNAVQGIWARDLDDATCAAINHKYRLLAYGRANGEGIVYQVDEATGGLEVTHKLALSSRDFAGDPGPVGFLKWSPDGTVLAMCWSAGGFSLWSVFGSLLTASLKWDYSEDSHSRPIAVSCMEWGAEGYESWCVQVSRARAPRQEKLGGLLLATGTTAAPRPRTDPSPTGAPPQPFSSRATAIPEGGTGTGQRDTLRSSNSSCDGAASLDMRTNVLQFSFIKSALTVNPSMSRLQRVLLQGSDRLYLSTPEEMPTNTDTGHHHMEPPQDESFHDFDSEDGEGFDLDEYHRHRETEQNTFASSNKQWLVVPIPYSYTASNYPIRYVCADPSCSVVGVAGRNGVAHYSVRHRRWHLFGNESQEEDFVVTGGLVWWRSSYLVLGAYNIPANADELRLYPNHQKLDDQFCTVIKQPAQVLLLNIYSDLLAVLTADCHITVYHLSLPPAGKGGAAEAVLVRRVQEVDISGLAVHPACVVSIALTSLRTESPRLPHHVLPTHHRPHSIPPFSTSYGSTHGIGPTSTSSGYRDFATGGYGHTSFGGGSYRRHGTGRSSAYTAHPRRYLRYDSTRSSGDYGNRGEEEGEEILKPPAAQSLIFNISGKVLMIQRDQTTTTEGGGKAKDKEQENGGKLFQHAQMTPIVLASCCESLWCSDCSASLKPHLSHALWLHCGAQGTRAWLPLFPNSADQSHTFLARRIMLPVMPSIYPLAVLFEEGILLGAETDSSLVGCDASALYQPAVIVTRTSQVYLQDVLRQLLRRNLGYHAWEVASTCHSLPHFPHALELLLHQVLEEEATSKEPLPDSLLPRVLDFIREFPALHLQTVVRCARKTELPLWRFLFSVAGSPSTLFSQALTARQLDTAASYLIILQNLESASVSRSHATRLLDATLEAGNWHLCKDLIRFLGAIDPSDLDSPKPSFNAASAAGGAGGGGGGSTKVGFSHAAQPVSPACVDEDLSMILPNTQALRGRSYSNASGSKGINISPGGGGDGSQQQQSSSGLRSSADLRQGERPGLTRKRSSNSTGGKDCSPDEYFVDVILQRHAKKLLMGRRLRDLGTMAARLDFPVVSWLRRERCRAARLDDFVAALRMVHVDFSWPYPSVPASSLRRYSVSSLGAPERHAAVEEVDQRFRELSLAINKVPSLAQGKIGDSGYLSQTTGAGDTQAALTPQHGPHGTRLEDAAACMEDLARLTSSGSHAARHSLPDLADVMPRQAMLLPHPAYAGDLMSVMSEEGSSVVGGSVCGAGTDYYCGPDGDPTRDLLARSPDPPLQPSPETPPHAQVQLRYLLQVFLEAGCLEWSAVVSVVLRDALAVVRVVTAAKDAPLPALSRLLHGLTALTLFTHTHCLGYQSFMAAISPQMHVLETLIKSRGESCLPPSSPTASHSVPKSGPIPSNQRTASGVVDAVGQATVLSQHDSSGMKAAPASLSGPSSLPLGPCAGNSLLPSPTDGNPPPPPTAHYSLPKAAASGRLNSKVDRAGSHSQDDSSEDSRSVRNSAEEVSTEPGACSLQ